MSTKFYAVAHGFKRGVFTDWDEAKKQIDNFPQPVYKKFDSEEEAEKYVEARKPKKIELTFPEPTHDHYYAVARGHVVGVFTDYADVKKHKFDELNEAIAYFKKFYEGNDGGSSESKKNEEKKKVSDSEVFYAVARGHETGVFSTWDECKKQTTGFKGAKFKKFDNKEDAEMFAQGKTLKQIEEAHSGGQKRKSGGEASEEVEVKKRKKN
ncbi:unnamed protein product [Caenorhabditis bovis]|uniref:ribonuclease H n=1 Tax=Caenorhabditis bovis TaxID=2654633 RepID=A0A8S1FDL8_9PELO|nr:unnamed protein product [Caenorhabditis bovis]